MRPHELLRLRYYVFKLSCDALAELPPETFFDVQLDIAATLAANAAALEGKPVYAQLMHDWRVASEKEVTADGRLAIAVLASFVEGLTTRASLPEPGTITICIESLCNAFCTSAHRFKEGMIWRLYLNMCAEVCNSSAGVRGT